MYRFLAALIMLTSSLVSANAAETGPAKEINPDFIPLTINPGGPMEPAQQTTPETENEQFNQFYGEFIKMLVMLGLIVVLLMVVTWFLKRMLNARMNQINSNSVIQVIEKRPLSQKTMLYVLEVSGRQLIIAESHNGVSSLTEFTRRPSFDKLMDEKPEKERLKAEG